MYYLYRHCDRKLRQNVAEILDVHAYQSIDCVLSRRKIEKNAEVKLVNEQCLYSDSLVEASQSGILFRKYYQPFGQSKFVRFSDILGIEKRLSTKWNMWNGKGRVWGTGDFKIWFPLDWHRPQRSCIFLLTLRTQRIRIGFTVENPEKFVEVIRKKGLEIQNS